MSSVFIHRNGWRSLINSYRTWWLQSKCMWGQTTRFQRVNEANLWQVNKRTMAKIKLMSVQVRNSRMFGEYFLRSKCAHLPAARVNTQVHHSCRCDSAHAMTYTNLIRNMSDFIWRWRTWKCTANALWIQKPMTNKHTSFESMAHAILFIQH